MNTTLNENSPRRIFIQMSGTPGSGKSTIARRIRQSLSGVIVDHDVLRSSLLESEIIPFDKAAKQAYILQWKIAEDMIKQSHQSIIIDGTCNYPQVIEQGASLAAQYGYKYWYIECSVSGLDLLDKRLRARTPMLSQRSAVDCPPAAAQKSGIHAGGDGRALFTRWMGNPCRPDDASCIIKVDSTADPDLICQDILTKLDSSS